MSLPTLASARRVAVRVLEAVVTCALLLVVRVAPSLLLHCAQVALLGRMSEVPLGSAGNSGGPFRVPLDFFSDGDDLSIGGGGALSLLDYVGLGPALRARMFRNTMQLGSALCGLVGFYLVVAQLLSYAPSLRLRHPKSCPRAAVAVVVLCAGGVLSAHIAFAASDSSKMLTKELILLVTVIVCTTIAYVTIITAVIGPVAAAAAWAECRRLVVTSQRSPTTRRTRLLASAAVLMSITIIISLATPAPLDIPVPSEAHAEPLFDSGTGSEALRQTPAVPAADVSLLARPFYRTATLRFFDPCRTSAHRPFVPRIRQGVAWAEFLPRRILNFFTGSEDCSLLESADAWHADAGLGLSGDASRQRALLDYETPAVSAALAKGQAIGPPPPPADADGTFVAVPLLQRMRFPRPGREISDYDRTTGELLVADTCPGGGRPVVIVEEMRGNNLGPDFEQFVVERLRREFKSVVNAWPAHVEERLGSVCRTIHWTSSGERIRHGRLPVANVSCIIHRVRYAPDRNDSFIERVEQVLPPTQRAIPALHAPQHAVRASIVRSFSGRFLALPIRTLSMPHHRLRLLTESVSVVCPHSQELHTHPLMAGHRYKEPPTTPNPHRKNLLFLIFDAVSRQEVGRNLPRTAQWLSEHTPSSTNTPEGPVPAPVVVECAGQTTMGHSTAGNLVPALGGAFYTENSRAGSALVAAQNIFALSKRKYGQHVFTSIATGYCGHSSDMLFDSGATPRPSMYEHEGAREEGGEGRLPPGFGGPNAFMDKDWFAPMCDHRYGAQEGNLQGGYSIRKRCLGQRHVHDHLLEYTEDMIHLLMRGGEATKPFIHMSYFLEGHEGSHAVLRLVDRALSSLLLRLEHVYDFFSTDRNMLVFMSDHGNHMGPYFEWSAIGEAERTTPFLTFISNRSFWEMGEWLALHVSASRVTTPADLYLTLTKILDVTPTSPYFHKAVAMTDPIWLSRSLNAPRFARKTCEEVGTSNCILRYCEREQ